MPHYGTLRDTKLEQDADDLRGAEVYGVNDEKLGKIDDVIFDHASGEIRYVVVETGGLFSKKSFLVPANRVSPYGNHEDKFYAELDKERIQMLPEYDEKALKSEDNWTEYEKHYEDQWKDGALMYNTSTGRMITPPPEQVSGIRKESLGDENRTSIPRDFTPERLGREDDLLGAGTSRSATLEPKKPSIAGRKDAILAGRDAEIDDINGNTIEDRGTIDARRTEILDREDLNTTHDANAADTRLNDPRFDDSRIPPQRESLGQRMKDKIIEVKDDVLSHTPRADQREGDVIANREGLSEPGVYRADNVPEAEKRSDLNEPLNANYGPRWNKFQSRLRERRDDVIAECPICGSQRKVA
jgi:sporulation protein YlmC with PRC-barrel domain